MKVILMFLLVIALQEPAEYPPGHVCVYPQDVKSSEDHACDCHRECKEYNDGEGNKTYGIQEDPKCMQYCHKDHCKCPLKNCE